MGRAVDTRLVQVLLVSPYDRELRKTKEELDKFVRELLDTFGAAETPDLLHSLGRIVRDAGSDTTPEVRAFLTGVIDLDQRASLDDIRIVGKAIAKDFTRRNEVLADTFTASNVKEMLGISRQQVNNRWKAGKLLGFVANDETRFPTWQFDANERDGVLPGLTTALEALKESGLSVLDQIYWLTSPRPEFDGNPPVEALRSGLTDEVAAQARGAGVS